MNREIALVCENPEAHRALVERLQDAGFRVLLWRSPEEAIPLSGNAAGALAAILYDFSSPRDCGPVAELGQRYSGLPQLLFHSFQREDGQQGELESLERLSGVRVFYRSLADPSIFRLVEEAITPTPAPAILSLQKVPLIENRVAGREHNHKNSPFQREEFLRRVGAADVPVLLHGETGAGKEVMARRLWSYSSRASKPFLKLNCAALPSELIESELFGYERGAFTGATMDKPGKFELAQNGTILLDEIGDMDIRLQAKLLQVLQDGEVQPLGSSRIVNVNVRIMAATHRDLRGAIEQGSFREDLYYRLNVINLTIPPLRECRGEILSLAEQLLLRHRPPGTEPPTIAEPLRQAMLTYRWPGNVRELENVMRRFLVYQDAEFLARELMESSLPAEPRRTIGTAGEFVLAPVPIRPESPRSGSNVDYLAQASREAESKLLLETLEAVRWNRRQAAARLNVDYKAFLYKLQKHGIVESKAKRKDAGA